MSDVVYLSLRDAERLPDAALRFERGKPVPPFSIGRYGTWPLGAPGIGDRHLWVTFDGERLVLQRDNGQDEVVADGCTLGLEPWPVPALPCVIRLGALRLLADTAFPLAFPHRSQQSRPSVVRRDHVAPGRSAGAAPIAGSSSLAHTASSRRADGDDAASTRLMPVEYMLAELARYQKRRAAAPKPRPARAFRSWSSLCTYVRARAASFALPRLRKLGRRRATLIALAIVSPVIVVRWLLTGPLPRAELAPEGAAPPGVELPRATAPLRRGSSPAASERAAPLPSLDSPPTVAAKRSRSVSVARRGERPADKTLERRAVDALAAGDTQRALALYQQLATALPESVAYAEAYRILLSDAAAR